MELTTAFVDKAAAIVPDDWDISTVGDEFLVELGKMLDSEKNVGVLKPFIGNRAVQWGHIDTSDIGNVRLTPSDQQRYRLQINDLLVCEGGEVGRAAIWREPIAECYYQKALHRLRPKRGFNVTLMLNLLQYFSANGLLAQFVTQTSIAHLPKEKFVSIPIPFPPLPEQRAIAEALGDVDALLAALDAVLAKKRDLKQAAMQQLLTGQTRLPGFSGEWVVKRIGELLEVAHGKSQRDVEVRDGKFPILATGGQIGTANRFLYDRPSVLIGRKGTIDRPQYMESPFWSVDTLFYSIIREPNNAKFIFYRFCMISWRQYNEASGVPSLNARTIENIELCVPGEREQTAIAAILSDMDAELTALEDRRTKTQALKQGMMQELLTGRTRLV